jgi:large subunit ribosomal protein L17
MRHRIQDKKFNRDANERKALFMGLLRNLTEQGQIVTTRARAKVIKRLADKMITQAKVDTIASRRELHKIFGKRDVVNTLVDRVAPAMADRNSGYTRVVALGSRRGDNTPMVKLSFVIIPEQTGLKSGKTYAAKAEKPKAEKKAAPTAKAEKPATKVAAKTDKKVVSKEKVKSVKKSK